jgi:hypothetical protein
MVLPVIANGVTMTLTKPDGGTVERAFDKPVQLHGVTASVDKVKIPLVLTYNPITGSPATIGGYTFTCSAQSRIPFGGAKAIGIGGTVITSDGYTGIIPAKCGIPWLNIT